LALSAAISRLCGREAESAELALWTGRGQRSGIGIGAFAHGGFIVDGGRGSQTRVPPVLARADFPEKWRVLIVLDAQVRGLNGGDEHAAFDQLAVMSPQSSAHLSRLLLMQILPAIMESQFEAFAEGIGEVQETVGRYFAGFQRGLYSSQRVAAVMDLLKANGAAGVGQSSWGPTGFALAESADEAAAMLAAVNERFGEISGVRCRILQGRNCGGEVQLQDRALKTRGNLREL
jgi:beta-RFAP synthase